MKTSCCPRGFSFGLLTAANRGYILEQCGQDLNEEKDTKGRGASSSWFVGFWLEQLIESGGTQIYIVFLLLLQWTINVVRHSNEEITLTAGSWNSTRTRHIKTNKWHAPTFFKDLFIYFGGGQGKGRGKQRESLKQTLTWAQSPNGAQSHNPELKPRVMSLTHCTTQEPWQIIFKHSITQRG